MASKAKAALAGRTPRRTGQAPVAGKRETRAKPSNRKTHTGGHGGSKGGSSPSAGSPKPSPAQTYDR